MHIIGIFVRVCISLYNIHTYVYIYIYIYIYLKASASAAGPPSLGLGGSEAWRFGGPDDLI